MPDKAIDYFADLTTHVPDMVLCFLLITRYLYILVFFFFFLLSDFLSWLSDLL